MERSLRIPLLFLLASVGLATGQEIGTDICACSPRSYEFTLDFGLTCPPVNIPNGNAVDGSSCLISPFGALDVTDLVPVSVDSIDILELGQNLRVIAQTDVDQTFNDGDTFTYTSIVADPDSIEEAQQVPRALQISIVGNNQAGDRIVNFFLVTFTNQCDEYPVFEEGQSAGWAKFTGLGPGSPELCSAIEPIVPTDAPVSPTMSPVAPVAPPTPKPIAPPTPEPITPPTPEPTPAPITPPTPEPVVDPTEPPTMDMSMSMSLMSDIDIDLVLEFGEQRAGSGKKSKKKRAKGPERIKLAKGSKDGKPYANAKDGKSKDGSKDGKSKSGSKGGSKDGSKGGSKGSKGAKAESIKTANKLTKPGSKDGSKSDKSVKSKGDKSKGGKSKGDKPTSRLRI